MVEKRDCGGKRVESRSKCQGKEGAAQEGRVYFMSIIRKVVPGRTSATIWISEGKLYNHETLIGCGFAVAGSGEKARKPRVHWLISSRPPHVTLLKNCIYSGIGRTYER